MLLLFRLFWGNGRNAPPGSASAPTLSGLVSPVKGVEKNSLKRHPVPAGSDRGSLFCLPRRQARSGFANVAPTLGEAQ